jgi:ferritin-like metal-binding protein YciE
MEKQALDMMESQSNRLEDYPEVRQRAERHAAETKTQLERLERALHLLGEEPSTLKNLAMRTAANFQGLMHGAVTDEVIKDSITGFAFEHFEIAAYRNLIVMAEHLGHLEIAESCRQSLREEQEMARWLDEHMDDTSAQFMARMGSHQGQTA